MPRLAGFAGRARGRIAADLGLQLDDVDELVGLAARGSRRRAQLKQTRHSEPIGDTGTKVTPHQGCSMKGKFTAILLMSPPAFSLGELVPRVS
jgi:hypothetical protein